jgi:integrase
LGSSTPEGPRRASDKGGEALRLKLADVDFDDGKILVRRTKTGDFRVVPLSPLLRKHLRRYLQRREDHVKKHGSKAEEVFLSESGGPCSVSTAETSFRYLSRAAGLGRV